MSQIDHRDPIYLKGEKDETNYEQLICGLDIEPNWRDADISDNSRKSDRFLPYRLVGDAPPPCEAGDVALFYVDGEWVEMEWLSEMWYEETTRTGRYHQARQGRASAERGDGYTTFMASLSGDDKQKWYDRRDATLRDKIEKGERWGWMVNNTPESCARGGATGGPRTATERNAHLRTLTKIIKKDDMTIRCEPGVIATRIVEQIMAIDADNPRMAPKDIHHIWNGGVSKGWELADIW